MMEAASTSETSVNFYQTTRRYNPEDSHLPSISNFLQPPVPLKFNILQRTPFSDSHDVVLSLR
jgi:hypothetical protein